MTERHDGPAPMAATIAPGAAGNRPIRSLGDRLLAAMESVEHGFCVIDQDWHLVYVNREYERLTGRPRHSLLGRNLWEEFPEILGTQFEQQYRQARSQVKETQFETLFAPLQRWFEVRVYPTEDGLAVYFHDITGSKRAEETLRQERDFSNALFDSQPGVLYWFDHTGKYLRWNQNLEKVSGYSAEEIALMQPLDFIQESDRSLAESEITRVLCDGHSSLEAGFLLKDGTALPYLFTGVAVELQGVSGLIGVGIDISARKAAERDLQILNCDLENRVAQRTEQLAAKSKELESFCYSVSHDLKAPLRGVEGYTRLLLEDYADQLDEQGAGYLHGVSRATKHMVDLIDDLLAYSMLERQTLRSTSIDLSSFVAGVLSMPGQEYSDVRVVVELPADLKVVADKEALAIVLRNLIDNAVKFSSKSSHPTVTIRGQRIEGVAELSIADNGIGFEMRHSERIFEIFQRLHRPEEFVGTGVGLAMVRKAAERMNGTVWAHSEVGRGATFFLRLPLGSKPE